MQPTEIKKPKQYDQYPQQYQSISKERKKQIQNALLNAAKYQFLQQKQRQREQRLIDNENSSQHDFLNGDSCHVSHELVAPISPSPSNLVTEVLHQLQKSMQNSGPKNPLLLDFGVGDGRWIIAAHEYNPDYRCIGYDIDQERLELARRNIKLYYQSIQFSSTISETSDKKQNFLQIHNQDVFQILQNTIQTEVDKANVMIFYLFREAMIKISHLLKERKIVPAFKKKDCLKDLPNIVQIVSVGFVLPGWSPPIWKDTFGGINVYIYYARRFE